MREWNLLVRGSPLEVIALFALSITSSIDSSFSPCLPLNFLKRCSYGTAIRCLVSGWGGVACAPGVSCFCDSLKQVMRLFLLVFKFSCFGLQCCHLLLSHLGSGFYCPFKLLCALCTLIWSRNILDTPLLVQYVTEAARGERVASNGDNMNP